MVVLESQMFSPKKQVEPQQWYKPGAGDQPSLELTT